MSIQQNSLKLEGKRRKMVKESFSTSNYPDLVSYLNSLGDEMLRELWITIVERIVSSIVFPQHSATFPLAYLCFYRSFINQHIGITEEL